MGFFTGPSAEWLSKVALGIASNFLQIMLIDEMDEELQEEMRRNLANEGFETSLGALTKATVQIIKDHNMGMWKRGKFLAKINGTLMQSGVDPQKSHFFVSSIETFATK